MNVGRDEGLHAESCRDECGDASEQLLCTGLGYYAFIVSLENQLDYLPIDSKFEVKRSQLQIHQKVGEGYFSDVFLGTLSQSIGKLPVAVKKPKCVQESIKAPEDEEILRLQRKSLRDELKIWGHLQTSGGGHENVLKLVGAITTDRAHFCLLTEYCEWGSLDQFLRKKYQNGEFESEIISEADINDSRSTTPAQIWKSQRSSGWTKNFEDRRERGQITTSDLLWFALQIARAMQFLTEKNVLHRDVALRNILLKSDFTLKIADFGLSKTLKDSNDEYFILESSVALPIRYLSPESIINGRFTIKSECWSFGVVIWELFTFAEKQPYSTDFEQSNSNGDFFKFLVNYLSSGRRLMIPSNVPIMTKRLITELWNGDPVQRPSFLACRKLIRRELLQSCEKILKEQTAPLHTSESSLSNVDDSVPQEILTDRPSAHKRGWVRRIAGILVFFIIAVAVSLVTQLVVDNSTDSGSAPAIQARNQPYVNFIPGFKGNNTFTFTCPLPKGVGAFSVISDIDAKSPVGAYIDFSTGMQYNIQIPTNSTFPHWIDAYATTRLQKTIVLSLVENEDNLLLVTYSASSMRLFYIDEESIDLDKKTFPLRSKIHEDNGTFYLICFMWNADISQETVFFVVEIIINDSGAISSDILNQKQPRRLRGKLNGPLIRSGTIYWLLKSDSLGNNITANVSKETKLVKIDLTNNENTTVLIANNENCYFNDDRKAIWYGPVIIDQNICYFVASASLKKSQLCYIDIERMTWDSLSLNLSNHQFLGNVTVAKYENESVLLHGLTESFKYYFVIVNFTALKSEVDSLIISISGPIKNFPDMEWDENICIHPDGQRAIMLHFFKGQIEEVNLTTGSLTVFQNSDYRNINFSAESIQIVSLLTRTLIIIVVRETSTGQLFLASYRISNKSVAFAERIPTGLVINEGKDKYGDSNYFQKDRSGQWYFVLYWLKWGDNQTHFHLLTFSVASNGSISFEVLFNNHILVGIWTKAFVFNGGINWMPGNQNKIKEATLICRFFLRVFFGTGLNATIKLSSSLINGLNLDMKEYLWSTPVVINDLIFFYVVTTDNEEIGQILFLDYYRKTWHMLQLDGNFTVKAPKKIMSSDNHKLFVLATKEAAADIIDVSELVQKFNNRLA